MRTRAAVLHEAGTPLSVEEVELDGPRAGEVLVRIAAAGVCHSDLHLAEGHLGEGRWPMVLGHEGAGVVERVGPEVQAVAPGDRVAFCFVPACGACRFCVAGKANLCAPAAKASWAGTLLDGTSRLRTAAGRTIQHFNFVSCFAERAVMPVGAVVRVPDGLVLWRAALLGCGAVTGFGAVRNAARVAPGESVCVIGCGGIGLQIITAARLAGAHPIVAVERDGGKRDLAVAHGAAEAVDPAATDTVAAVRSLVRGGVDHAFEAVGLPVTIRQAWDVLRPGGTAVVVGIAPQGVEVAVPALELLSEKALKGSYYGSGDPAAQLRELAALAAEGAFSVDDVVSHVTDLDGIDEAFARMRRGEGARTIAVMDEALAGRAVPTSRTAAP